MTTALLQTIHDPVSGRIDAKDLRKPTGFTLPQIARYIGVKPDTLKKNSAAPIAQAGLVKLVHAWEILQTIFPDDAAIRAWMHHPLPTFEGKTVLWLLGEHGVNAFEGLAEEMDAGTYG
jgi:hypothetical protein